MNKIVLAIMLVLGFGLTNASAYENTPEGVMLAFYEAIINKDKDKAMSFLDKKEFMRLNYKTKQKVDGRKAAISDNMAHIHSYQVKDPKQWQFKLTKKNAIEWSVGMRNPTHEQWENDSYYDNWASFPISFIEENGIWKISRI